MNELNRWVRAGLLGVAFLILLGGAGVLASRLAASSSAEEVVTAEWLRLAVPEGWSARGGAASPVPAARWSRAASITAAPFSLPEDLYRHKRVLSIPAGSYQVTVSAFRVSRHGTGPGPVPLRVSTRDRVDDRVEPPLPVAGEQFVRTQRVGDRTFTAQIVMHPSTDPAEGLRAVNDVLEGLQTLE